MLKFKIKKMQEVVLTLKLETNVDNIFLNLMYIPEFKRISFKIKNNFELVECTYFN